MAMEIVTSLDLSSGKLSLCQMLYGWNYYPGSPTPFDPEFDNMKFAERYVIKYGHNLVSDMSTYHPDPDYLVGNWALKDGGTIHAKIKTDYSNFEWTMFDSAGNSVAGTSGGAGYTIHNITRGGDELYLGFAVDDEEQKAGFVTLASYTATDIVDHKVYGSYFFINGTFTNELYVALKGKISTTSDPYGSTDDDNPGGTGGNPTDPDTDDSDNIDVPDLPSKSATDTGFVGLFNPTTAQLKSLASFMWSDSFDLDTFKKVFADPMECILGLTLVPCSVTSSDSKLVKFGNVSTGVYMPKVSSQWVSVNCGTVSVKEKWAAYLDYSPFTKFMIWLPFIGFRQLTADDIMKKSLQVIYHVDVLSGACVAYLKSGNSVLYEYTGQCALQIPVTGSNMNNTILNAVSVAGTVVGGVASAAATDGASVPLTLGALASQTGNAVMSAKPDISRSGGMGGAAAIMGNKKPFLIMTRPNQCVPSNQNKYTGYPSWSTRTLSSVTGFTKVAEIHLENINATDDEKNEIEMLLKKGVII